MRPYDSFGIGLLLLLVPVIAWRFGRFGGRRNWSVAAIVMMSLAVAFSLQVVVQAGFAYVELSISSVPREFGTVFARRLYDWLNAPELIAFLGVFASFLGMIGWSSVPARKSGAVS
jgi:hypothetical protein